MTSRYGRARPQTGLGRLGMSWLPWYPVYSKAVEGAALGAQEQVGASVAEAWVLFQHVWHEALPGSKGWTNILRRGRMRQTLLPGYHGVGCSTIGSLTEGSSGGMGHPSVVQDNDWDKEGSCEQGAANAQELGVGTGPEGIWAGHRQQE